MAKSAGYGNGNICTMRNLLNLILGIVPSDRADLVIGTDGTVQSSKIKGAPKALMQTVQEQVDDWLFEPAQRDGKPTEVVITIRFTVAVPRKVR